MAVENRCSCCCSTFAHFSFSSPVFSSGGLRVEMTTNFNLDEARARWPALASDLPADAQAAFASWSSATTNEIKNALESTAIWDRPEGSYRKPDKVRDLVLMRTPFPSRRWRGGLPTPLSAAQVARIGREAEGDPDPPDPGGASVEDQLAEMRRITSDLKTTILSQATTIQQLFNAQHVDQSDGDISSSYEVLDEVLLKIGKSPDSDKCSWMNLLPLSVKERKVLMSEHGGTFSSFPAELDMVETTKMRTEVRKATLTLDAFASKEVARYMTRNALTIKMAGTAFSRIVEMRRKLQECVTGSGDEDVVPLDDVISFLEVVEGTTGATVDLAVDVQTHLRLAVSRRIESALGVGHLRVDPLKKEKEDFLPPDVYEKISEAAQQKEDLQWAQQRLSSLKPGSGSFQGNPSHKSTGRGRKRGAVSQYKRGSNSGGGRGGRGKRGGSAPSPAPAPAPSPKASGKGTGKGK